jgi:hypothetical protein
MEPTKRDLPPAGPMSRCWPSSPEGVRARIAKPSVLAMRADAWSRPVRLLALVLILCTGGSACSGSKDSAEKQAPTSRSGTAPITNRQVGKSTPGSTRGQVPARFDPESFTAISDSDYWLLGSVPCRAGRCSSILRTTDGGRSFASIAAPALPTSGVVPTLRFADRRDGFAFVPGVGGLLYATHNGGATWNKLALRTVLALATGGGNAYAVTARCSLEGCTGYRFERSPVSADAWTATAMPFAPGGSVLDLAVHGSSVWLLGTPVGQESSQSDELARSSDGGRTFVTGPGPCVPGLGGELAPTSAGVVWAVCPTGMLARAWRSTDGGITFTRLTTPPLVNSAVLAPASQDTAVLARNGARSGLLRTTDGGSTWTAASTPGTATFAPWIGFTDAHVGAALVQTVGDPSEKIEIQVLWRTTDGGAHWSTVRFP